MKRSLPIFLTLLIVTAASYALDLKKSPDFIGTYESRGGQVRFPHAMHAEAMSTQCNFCHSALRTFGGISQLYGHKVCGECHEQHGGPQECSACHDRSKLKA